MRRNRIVHSLLFVVSIGILSVNTLAYDNDVDYMAPYVTVDPETGKLITVDPKKGTTTELSSSTAKATPAPDRTMVLDFEEKTPSDSLQMAAAITGMFIIIIGGTIYLRKLR